MNLIDVPNACRRYLCLSPDKYATRHYNNYLLENGSTLQKQYAWLQMRCYQDLAAALFEQEHGEQPK
jgi:hypothetical protein